MALMDGSTMQYTGKDIVETYNQIRKIENKEKMKMNTLS